MADSSCPQSPIHVDNSLHRVVITGGPCGGKTTSAAVISDRLQDLGWRVFRVPEAASILLAGGVNFYQLSEEQKYTFQKSLLKLMMSLEDSFMDVARSCGQRSIVLCDRGAMDCSAYMSDSAWEKLTSEIGQSTFKLRDARYDCVVHMVTAAEGARPFYNTESNVVRSETPDMAVELDQKVKDAWTGHPYFTVVDNSKSTFKNKISQALNRICKHIGESAPGLKKRKFLVRSWPRTMPVKYQPFDVAHDYLSSTDGSQHRLRRRGQYGVWTHHHTVRYPDAHGQRLELRRILTGREYASMLCQVDPKRTTVKKKRRSFVYNNQYYELDQFLEPVSDLILLESYMKDHREVKLPDFLDIIGEVTADRSYSMYNLALPKEQRIKPMSPVFDLLQRGIDK